MRLSRSRVRALPLPAAILVLGVGISVSAWRWLLLPEAHIKEFERDSATLAYQVTSHIRRGVDERSTASFVEWSREGITLETWTGYTDDWLTRNPDSVTVWAPRVRGGDTTGFEAIARAAYPDVEGGFSVKRMLDTGVFSEANATSAVDMWPILYVNPPDTDLVGYDVGSVPMPAEAIGLMLETNGTALTEVTVMLDVSLPGFIVFYPVFDQGGSSSDSSSSSSGVSNDEDNSEGHHSGVGEITGFVMKSTRIQGLVQDTLGAMGFSQRYPSADVAVFMRVYGEDRESNDDDNDDDDDVVDHNDQLLFDLKNYPDSSSAEDYRSERVSPLVVETRGTTSITSVASLTAGRAIVVVVSFDPVANWTVGSVALIVGCVTSLLVSLLVYGRQVLVLSYKDSMETARVHSSLKSRFVADMSHEIRTPLTGIIGTAELLAEQKLNGETAELVGTLQACSRILMTLVSDALDFSKIEAGELQVEARPVFLRQVLPEMIKVMRTTYRSPKGDVVGNVRLRLEMSESVAITPTLADEDRIRQVLVNLLSNAFKFTDSGHITVTVRCEPETPSKEAAVVPCCSARISAGGGGGAATASATPTEAFNPKPAATAATPVADNNALFSRPATSVAPTPAVNMTASDEALPPRSSFAGEKPSQHKRRVKVSPFFASPAPPNRENSALATEPVLAAAALPLGEAATEAEAEAAAAAAAAAAAGMLGCRALRRRCYFQGKDVHPRTDHRGLGRRLWTPPLAGSSGGQEGAERVKGRQRGAWGRPSYLRGLEASEYERAMLVVEVSDSGVGMTADQISRLFSPFSQVHHGTGRAVGGTGLRTLHLEVTVRVHGGTVGCRSTPGVGSTFHFSVLVGVKSGGSSSSSSSSGGGIGGGGGGGGTARPDGNGCRMTEASTCPCLDSAGSAVLAAEFLVRTPCVVTDPAANVRDRASKALRPCITQEWNLAVEGSKFSLTTEVLEQRRIKSKTSRRSGRVGGGSVVGGSSSGGGGTAEIYQADDRCEVVLEATAASLLLAGTVGSTDNDGAHADDNHYCPETATAMHLTSDSSSGAEGTRPVRVPAVAPAEDSSASAIKTEDDIGAGLAARMVMGQGRQQERSERDGSDGASSVVAERPRILVVDDFRMNRVLVGKMLEALDVELDAVEDGAKAVEACRRSKFSVILVDLIMPVMDGIGSDDGDTGR